MQLIMNCRFFTREIDIVLDNYAECNINSI